MWFEQFKKRTGFDFGLEVSTLAKKFLGKSYSEAEEFALSVYRRYILRAPDGNAKNITQNELKLYLSGVQGNIDKSQGGECASCYKNQSEDYSIMSAKE